MLEIVPLLIESFAAFFHPLGGAICILHMLKPFESSPRWKFMAKLPQSALLLKKQLNDLMKNPVEGFSAGLIDDSDIYSWEVVIIGPPETLYEGGIFKAHLVFPKEYPQRPPKMKFISEIWHPNIRWVSNQLAHPTMVIIFCLTWKIGVFEPSKKTYVYKFMRKDYAYSGWGQIWVLGPRGRWIT